MLKCLKWHHSHDSVDLPTNKAPKRTIHTSHGLKNRNHNPQQILQKKMEMQEEYKSENDDMNNSTIDEEQEETDAVAYKEDDEPQMFYKHTSEVLNDYSNNIKSHESGIEDKDHTETNTMASGVDESLMTGANQQQTDPEKPKKKKLKLPPPNETNIKAVINQYLFPKVKFVNGYRYLHFSTIPDTPCQIVMEKLRHVPGMETSIEGQILQWESKIKGLIILTIGTRRTNVIKQIKEKYKSKWTIQHKARLMTTKTNHCNNK